MNEVYVLHFVDADGKHYRQAGHAGHYIGFCSRGLPSRLAYHKRGEGSRLLRAVAQNAELVVAFVTTGDRGFEKRLKKWKGTDRFCPICRGDAKVRRHFKSGRFFTAFRPYRRERFAERFDRLK